MSDEKVVRPQSDGHRIHSKNEFELCYIRHQYFRKVNFNPHEKDMKPYSQIIKYMSISTYYVYRNLFQAVGFELDDIISIGQIHLVSFLGLFAMERMPEKYKEFLAINKKNGKKKPTKNELLNKNRANFTLFLKQRMEDVVRVCRQKARNIKGFPTEEFYIFYGPKKPPKIARHLIKGYEAYGYKKMDLAVFKSIRKKANLQGARAFKFGRNWYICVPIEQKQLTLEDFSGADMDPYDNIHNKDPETIYLGAQEDEYWHKKKRIYQRKTSKQKAQLLKNFIEENQEKPDFQEEIRTAKRLLKSLEI